MSEQPTEAQVLAMGRVQRGAPFWLMLNGIQCLQLVGFIQVALRHPENTGPAAQQMTALAWTMRDELVGREPDLAPIIDAGWAAIPNDRRN
jgi:hypothetical protein